MKPQICNDCLKPIAKGGYFWLKAEIWLSIAKFEEILCLRCTEKRLGRALVKADFSKQYPINYAFGYLPLLKASPAVKRICRRIWGVA